MEKEHYERISYKLSVIIGLLAEERLKSLTATQAVKYLNDLGVDKEAIAVLREVKPKTVTEMLSRAK
jgi:hypothetical protein